MQPASEFQRIHRFDETDLAANRAGMLSQRQSWRLAATRLAEFALGTLVIFFAVALVIDMLRLAPSFEAILILVGAIVGIMAALLGIHLRRVLSAPVRTVSGPALKHAPLPLEGIRLKEISVAQCAFYVRSEVYDLLERTLIYRVYYVARSEGFGGNVLLSAEIDRNDGGR